MSADVALPICRRAGHRGRFPAAARPDRLTRRLDHAAVKPRRGSSGGSSWWAADAALCTHMRSERHIRHVSDDPGQAHELDGARLVAAAHHNVRKRRRLPSRAAAACAAAAAGSACTLPGCAAAAAGSACAQVKLWCRGVQRAWCRVGQRQPVCHFQIEGRAPPHSCALLLPTRRRVVERRQPTHRRNVAPGAVHQEAEDQGRDQG